MSNSVDAARLPIAARYLAGLPNQFDSHPDCLAHTESIDYLRETQPDLVKLVQLPEPARRVFTREDKREWVPEVATTFLFLAVRDLKFKNDQDWINWCGESATKLYAKPWAKVLMFVLSPTLIVMGAAKRWSAFHRGSVLTTEGARHEGNRVVVRATLTFGPGLFDDVTLRRFAKAYEAALVAIKAKGPRSTLVEKTATTGVYDIGWDG